MEALSSESKGMYDLLRANITTDVNTPLHSSQELVLKAVQNMLDETAARINDSLTSKIEAVREDLGVDIAQMCLADDKGSRGELLHSSGTSFNRTGGSSSGTADPLHP